MKACARASAVIEIDARGLKCPLPVLMAKKVLRNASGRARFKLLCTDPMAAIDIPVLIGQLQLDLIASWQSGDTLIFEFDRG